MDRCCLLHKHNVQVMCLISYAQHILPVHDVTLRREVHTLYRHGGHKEKQVPLPTQKYLARTKHTWTKTRGHEPPD
jgi:hypothetical protein